jgi:hypothetical protein
MSKIGDSRIIRNDATRVEGPGTGGPVMPAQASSVAPVAEEPRAPALIATFDHSRGTIAPQPGVFDWLLGKSKAAGTTSPLATRMAQLTGDVHDAKGAAALLGFGKPKPVTFEQQGWIAQRLPALTSTMKVVGFEKGAVVVDGARVCGVYSNDAKVGVRVSGTADARDAAAVLTELMRLSPKERVDVDTHATVVVCRNAVTEHLTHLKGVKPRGWPPGSTWDGVPGVFAGATNEVVVATKKPGVLDHAGSKNVVLHEVGHALDWQQGLLQTQSDKSEFIAAWSLDYGSLPSYLQQTPPAGPSEAFAESLAMRRMDPGALATQHPALHAYWEAKDATA